MSAPTINKEKQVKAPDLGRFGFLIKPVVYRRKYGFDEARAILLLDGNGLISKETAKESNLTSLLTSSTSTLYSINPIDGKYPSASELLQKLKLGRIAQHKTTTIKDIEQQFNSACQQVGIDHTAISAKNKIGVNSHGNDVYEMLNGRYRIDDSGIPTREGELHDFLYAVDEDGELDRDALKQCVAAFFDKKDMQFIDQTTLTHITNIILQAPPKKLNVDNATFTPISFVDKKDISTDHFKEFYNTLVRMDAEKLQNIKDAKSLLNFFQLVYKRKLSTARAFQHDLPAPLIAALGEILFHDGKQKVYSPIVGSSFMLSLFLGKKKANPDVTLELQEPFLDSKESLESFLAATKDIYEDTEVDVDSILIDTDFNPVPHELCMSFAPVSDTHIAVKVPHSAYKTHSRAHQIILETLAQRNDNGRSIFISAVDNNNKLGELHESSTELISYLYRQYANVMIFDLHKSLLNPSLFNYPVRIFIIGSRTDFGDNFEYQNFVSDGDIPVLSKPNEFFAVCQEYIQEVENEATSTIDLMSVFEIDSAIQEADIAEEAEERLDENDAKVQALVDEASKAEAEGELSVVAESTNDTPDSTNVDYDKDNSNSKPTESDESTPDTLEGTKSTLDASDETTDTREPDSDSSADDTTDTGEPSSDSSDDSDEDDEDDFSKYEDMANSDDEDDLPSDEDLGLNDDIDLSDIEEPPDLDY